MSYTQIYDLWVTDDLRKQIVISILKASVDILNESGATENHANRVTWANNSMNDPHLMAAKLSAGVIMNPKVQSGVFTDDDIQWVVNSLINTFAR